MPNRGKKHHLFTLVRLPADVSYGDFQRQVLAHADSVWSLAVEGSIEESEAWEKLRALLPDWYPGELVQPGGVSLTAPGRTAETTVDLEPGRYVLECYVMTPERQFHLLLGMAHPLTVVPGTAEAGPPEADHELTVANLELEGVRPVVAGKHTFAVHFEEDPEEVRWQHVHLARLDGGTDPGELAGWMRVDPVMPAPVEFLGGAQHMPAGNTAYVTVELEPGEYAWILGVPPELEEVEPFTVE